MDKLHEIEAALKGISDNSAYEARLFCDSDSDISVNEFVSRRQSGEPASKILGKRGFWKDEFHTSVDVLDPRSDSETLIETVLKYLPDTDAPLRILDIGTGSGCLLFSLLGEYKNATGMGVDKSQKALAVAHENKNNRQAELHQVDFMQPDWIQNFGQFDIIISNPPYIKSDDIESLDVSVKKYDPLLALDGGADGLNAYRALATSLASLCHPDSKIFFEIGQGQSVDVCNLMHQNGFEFLSEHKDLGDIVRVLVFKK